MYDQDGAILYVGKAKNLKNRVSSYFRNHGLAPKTQALVAKIVDIQVTVTNSETEALLLEQNLIKSLSPPYNILLRDDKSYPYIYIDEANPFPALTFKRARKKGRKGTYFGPFPSAGAVRDSLNLLQKIFQVRQCDESFFRNRERPCLQYQIKRCTAPCVGLISEAEYRESVRHAVMFLQGKSPKLIAEILDKMQQASEALAFEQAAIYRDQINHLRHVQESQAIEGGHTDVDVIAIAVQSGAACIQVIFVRGGRVLGSKNYFPKLSLEEDQDTILESFLSQFYIGGRLVRDMPREIILSHSLDSMASLEAALEEVIGRQVPIRGRVRGDRLKWLNLAVTNADIALQSHLANKENLFQRYRSFTESLGLGDVPNRIECFDISHSHGEATVASCVVFGVSGALKNDYRQYNIEDITAGDDYAAMEQVLQKRYGKLRSQPEKMPDVILIDGGKGQLNIALQVFEQLQIEGVLLLGVAKGVTRKPGLEVIINGDTGAEAVLASDSPGLHLIQQIRDEAHRYAIMGHRQRRDKKRRRSVLEDIEGIGPKRRRTLIQYFGGLQEINKASVEEIAKAPGISQNLARIIYDELHRDQ
ncbi:MAG: excinuclease ABC subunit UvrC [Pseudomonadales bacterium]|nr:excinuclease ABC subunit UvrC [Pseudomonadales bacterium]